MTAAAFARVPTDPRDLLSGIFTLPRGYIAECFKLVPDWIDANTYLEWAKKALGQGGDFGYNIATSCAKLAVCRTIDGFLVDYHLRCFLRDPYPKKIETLEGLGGRIPPVVHELVIAKRNDLEHK